MSKKEIVLTVVGATFILAGLVFNEWVLAYFTSDGKIDSGSQLLIIRIFDVSALVIGALIIFFRKSQLIPRLLASLVILAVTFFVLDLLLYLAVPVLPASLVTAMSPNAQLRYIRSNPASNPWVYDDYIRYVKPNTVIELFDISITSDSLGYRNPENYLAEHSDIDIVLLGDSFIWGTEEQTVADYLRAEAAPLTVYSAGMSGSGISQWRYHYARFIDETGAAPRAAVLNFYSGNDLTDTGVFLGLQDEQGRVNSADFYSYINYQFLVPSTQRSFALPKLPELLFIANYTFNLFQNRNIENEQTEPSLVIGGEPALVCAHHREPLPELFTPEIMAEIKHTVDTIRALTPETQILLSYIPTSGGIYGDLMQECPEYSIDIDRQQAASQILADYAANVGIAYADFTPELRAQAQTTLVWSQIDHFSPQGYQIYSEQLAGTLQELLAQK